MQRINAGIGQLISSSETNALPGTLTQDSKERTLTEDTDF